MEENKIKELIRNALEARKFAYAPFSNWTVGASLLCADGKIYNGCNIENSGLTATCCAERTAIFKAVSEGETYFTAIAVLGGKAGELPKAICAPCGVCRQVMQEFCTSDFIVILAVSEDEYTMSSLGELLPYGFNL